MALLGSFTKQPREVLDCDIDYATVLAGRADTISGTPTTEVSPSEAQGVVVATPVVNSLVVKLKVSGGLDATGLYKITILTTTTPAGLIYEDEINVLVEES